MVVNVCVCVCVCVCTKDENGIRESAKDGEEKAADDSGVQDGEEELAPFRQQLCSQKEKVAIDQQQEQVAENGVSARQEAVGRLTRRRRRRRRFIAIIAIIRRSIIVNLVQIIAWED